MLNVIHRHSLTRAFVTLSIVGILGGCATTSGPLATLPMVSPGASELNTKGIQYYQKSQWEQARSAFEAAIERDSTLPEAHFNLALTFHKLGSHEKAKAHFSRAGELAPNNKDIVESSLYRNHLGLSTTLEKHIGGGYRY